MKLLISLFVLFLLSIQLLAQQIQENEAQFLSSYANEQKPPVYINSPSGQRYVRTLLKISQYDPNFIRYSLSLYDSLSCDANGLVLTRFSKSEGSSEGTKTIYEYDDNGRIISKLSRIKNGDSWVNSSRYSYEYNYRDSITQEKFGFYIDTTWVERIRVTREYDDAGRLIEIFTSTKLDNNSPYEDYSKILYEYNSNGDVINWAEDFMENGVWKKTFNTSWTYDKNYHLLEELSQSFWNGSAWSLMSKKVFTRDEQGLPLTRIYITTTKNEGVKMTDSISYAYYPDGKLKDKHEVYFSALENNYVHENYSYNENGLVSLKTIEKWSENTEITSLREANFYNSENNLLKKTYEEWSDSLSLWVPKDKVEYSYDNNGNCIKIEALKLKNEIWIPSSFRESVYAQGVEIASYNSLAEMSYTLVNSIAIEDDVILTPSKFALNQNYPNPFNPETKINFTLPQSGKAALRIYDILGREVAELVNGEMEKGPHTISFNGRYLSSGVYIYRLQSGSFTESKKMMLIK